MNTIKNNSRRKFLSFLTKSLHSDSMSSSEKVKLLTADGKLVEVDARIVQQAKSGSKVTNQEILTWSNSASH